MQVKQHLTRHLLENVVACPECGHGFKHQSDLRTHFNLVHNKTILCDFPDCTYVSPSPSDLVRHKEAVHVKSLPYKCIMEECERRFSGKTEMLDHFFFYCVQPDWVFCQDCKYRCYKRSTYNDHWTDTKHLKNVEILESRGIQPSPPTFNLNDEIKKASLDPAAYKAQYCSAPLLGISSVPIFNIKGIMETVEPFRGFIPHSGILPKGTIWCSDTGVAAINQCSYIDASVFPTMKSLADYLNYLDTHPSEYEKYFEWKKHYKVAVSYFDDAWCSLCTKLWTSTINSTSSSAITSSSSTENNNNIIINRISSSSSNSNSNGYKNKHDMIRRQVKNLTNWWFHKSSNGSLKENACLSPTQLKWDTNIFSFYGFMYYPNYYVKLTIMYGVSFILFSTILICILRTIRTQMLYKNKGKLSEKNNF